MRESELHVYMLVFGLLATRNGELFSKFRKNITSSCGTLFPVLNMNRKCTHETQCADLF